jgi:hypothetical protein
MDSLISNVHAQVAVGFAQHSLPFTAATLALKACQMTVNTLAQGQLIEEGELYRARKQGFGHLATLGERVNRLMQLKRVNQESEAPPLLLDPTNVSRTIECHGNVV